MKPNIVTLMAYMLILVMGATLTFAAQMNQNTAVAETKIEADANANASTSAEAATAFFPTTIWEFEPVVDGKQIVHDFLIQNKGTALLQVEKVKTG
jgi:hypothetical protein